tara:strand:+ start:1202 stop:1957 length:756 start_codon:yes stop_codon:yes gene_type:complete
VTNKPPQDFKDRIVMVTGAGDGIGRTAAKTLADHGATVILLGRTVSKLESLYDEICQSGAPEPGIVPMDLLTTTEEVINEMAAAIDQQYSRLDGILHNASILGTRIPFASSSLNEWRDVMQVNFIAPVMLTRLLFPLVERSKDASVVFTSSSVGNKPRAYWSAYAVSKYALEGLALLLADELENTSPIRVNIVNPAATRTAMRAAAYPAEDPDTVKTPDELMPLYLYLLGTDHQGEHGELFDPRSWEARDR